MITRPYHVLFLCTGNTARSILAESILRHLGAGRFAAFSAGSHPKGVVHSLAKQVLAAHRYPSDALRSKSWTEFAQPGAPSMDFIFTVCDSAAGESCPIWPGHPASAHWGIADPASVEGSEEDQLAAFEQAFGLLHARIAAFVDLPLDALDPADLSRCLTRIGEMDGATRLTPVR
jgi:arsenate reductase